MKVLEDAADDIFLVFGLWLDFNDLTASEECSTEFSQMGVAFQWDARAKMDQRVAIDDVVDVTHGVIVAGLPGFADLAFTFVDGGTTRAGEAGLLGEPPAGADVSKRNE